MRSPLPFLLLVFFAGAASFGHAAPAAIHRVALGAFTSDENTWESIQAAETVAPALQAMLSTEPGVEWVERQEASLLFQEKALVSTLGNSIRQARLAKADWMVSGRFVSPAGGKCELLLEAIDLAHADVLVEQRVPLASPSLREAARSLSALAAGVRALLTAAAQREREVAGRPAIAVLFFPDLDVFQREFQAALEDPQLGAGQYRLLHLPRASVSAGEAELVLAGFTDDQDGIWRGIADAYVWGSLKRRSSGSIDGVTVTDARTPDIVLNAWDGRLSPVQFKEESAPIDRPKFEQAVREQARRLAGSVAEFVRHPRSGAQDDAQRVLVSRGLLRAADALEEDKASNAWYLTNVEGRRHFLNLVQTLESASFLDPQNPAALQRLIQTRYSRRAGDGARSRFRFEIGRREAWARYVERFGPDSGPTVKEQIQALLLKQPVDQKELSRLFRIHEGWPVAWEYLNSACEAFYYGTYGNRDELGYPAGVPEAASLQWEDALAREVARRLLVVAGHAEAAPLQGLGIVFNNRGPKRYSIADPKYRIQVLEQAWPALRSALRKDLPPEWRDTIARSYVDAGRPGGEEPLFASVTPVAGTPPPASPPPPRPWSPAREKNAPIGLFSYQPLSVPAPELVAPFEKLDGFESGKIHSVDAMVILAGRIWLIGQGFDDTPVQAPNTRMLEDFRPVSERVKRLYVFDPAAGTIHRVEAASRFSPFSLFVHEGRLWVSFGRDGVAVLDPKTESLRRFGRDEGLAVASAYRFAAAGGKLFVTADLPGLHVFDPSAERWSAHALGKQEFAGPSRGGDSRFLSGLGPWLLHTQGPVAVEDLRTGAWRSYHELQANGVPLSIRGLAGVQTDSTGFWLSSETAVSHLDPATGQLTSVLPVPNPRALRADATTAEAVAALNRLRAVVRPEASALLPWQAVGAVPGPVYSMLADGDFLWVTAGPFYNSRTSLLLWHEPSRRWIGQHAVGFAPTLAADEEFLWFTASDFVGGPRAPSVLATLHRVEKRLLFPGTPTPGAVPSELQARAAYEKLSPRDRAFHSFARGRYAEAAALFAQVPDRIPEFSHNIVAEALFMQALCHDAQGLARPEKQRALLREFLQRFPDESLTEETRRQLAALPPP